MKNVVKSMMAHMDLGDSVQRDAVLFGSVRSRTKQWKRMVQRNAGLLYMQKRMVLAIEHRTVIGNVIVVILCLRPVISYKNIIMSFIPF